MSVRETENGSGDGAIEIPAVNFYFCLCISGGHLVGEGINHAEGSVMEGNPLPPGLYYLLSIQWGLLICCCSC